MIREEKCASIIETVSVRARDAWANWLDQRGRNRAVASRIVATWACRWRSSGTWLTMAFNAIRTGGRCGARCRVAHHSARGDVRSRSRLEPVPQPEYPAGPDFRAVLYRTRPYGDDPNQCIFEAYALEHYPRGEERQTEWIEAEPTAEFWGSVLEQDFNNMQWVQKGMKSRGFRGALPNPHQEQKITNFHRHLSQIMGGGHPHKIESNRRQAK